MYVTRRVTQKLPSKIPRNPGSSSLKVSRNQTDEPEVKQQLQKKWQKTRQLDQVNLEKTQAAQLMDKDKTGRYIMDPETIKNRLDNPNYKFESPLSFLSDSDRRLPKSWSQEDQQNFQDSIKSTAFKEYDPVKFFKYLRLFWVVTSTGIVLAFTYRVLWKDQLFRDHGRLSFRDRYEVGVAIYYKNLLDLEKRLAEKMELSEAQVRQLDLLGRGAHNMEGMTRILEKWKATPLTAEQSQDSQMRATFVSKGKVKNPEEPNLLERNANYSLLRCASPKGSQEVLPHNVRFFYEVDSNTYNNYEMKDSGFQARSSALTDIANLLKSANPFNGDKDVLLKSSKWFTLEDYYHYRNSNINKNVLEDCVKVDNNRVQGKIYFDKNERELCYPIFHNLAMLSSTMFRDWLHYFKEKYMHKPDASEDSFFWSSFLISCVYLVYSFRRSKLEVLKNLANSRGNARSRFVNLMTIKRMYSPDPLNQNLSSFGNNVSFEQAKSSQKYKITEKKNRGKVVRVRRRENQES